MAGLPLIKTASVGFVFGCCLYASADVLSDYTTFVILRDQALVLAEDSRDLKDQIGHPFSVAPWYNASIGFTGAGNIAQCTFQLVGTKQVTDVTARAIRRDNYAPNNALYNLLGPGQWKLVGCTAMFPAGGGLAQPRSIMPEPALPPGPSSTAEGSAGSQGSQHAGHQVPKQNGQPGKPHEWQQQQQQQQQQGNGVSLNDSNEPAGQQLPVRPWWKIWR